MAEYDIHSKLKGVVAFDQAVIATDTTTNGNWIDLTGFEAVEFFLTVGLLTDGTYDLIVNHATDISGTDAQLVVAGDLVGLPGQLDTDDTLSRVGYIGGVLSDGTYAKRNFVLMSIVSATTTTGATASGMALLGMAHSQPVADQ